jgi:hypothetical protein
VFRLLGSLLVPTGQLKTPPQQRANWHFAQLLSTHGPFTLGLSTHEPRSKRGRHSPRKLPPLHTSNSLSFYRPTWKSARQPRSTQIPRPS